jgi:hypothetical protein
VRERFPVQLYADTRCVYIDVSYRVTLVVGVFVGPPPQFNELGSFKELQYLPETNPLGAVVALSMLALTMAVSTEHLTLGPCTNSCVKGVWREILFHADLGGRCAAVPAARGALVDAGW